MHDFILAKEILDELKRIVVEKKLQNIKKVKIEIGQIAMAHDGHPEHTEDISIENLKFGLENISRNTDFVKTVFEIIKVSGDNWRITDVEIE
jgi:Zn finger protein HypA/HybF involved in hydrogenase expression